MATLGLVLHLLATAGVVALAIGLLALAASGPAAWASWQVERRTGARTPWRPAVALGALVLTGAVLMLL